MLARVKSLSITAHTRLKQKHPAKWEKGRYQAMRDYFRLIQRVKWYSCGRCVHDFYVPFGPWGDVLKYRGTVMQVDNLRRLPSHTLGRRLQCQ